MKKKSLMLSVASVAMFLAACGDEITQVNQTTGMEVVAAGQKLGPCSDENAGEMKFVTDSSAVLYCAEGKWQTLNGKDGEKGEPGDKGEPGEPGEPGKNGIGKDGTSCSASVVEEGIEVSCDDKVVGIVKNGSDGVNGTSCVISSDKGGIVEITCGEGENAETATLYKAVCGAAPYDPAVDFCIDGKTYPLCDGEAYDPSEMFCLEGDLFFMCNGATYDPKESFCYGDALYSCGGEAYNPETKYCLELTSGEKRIEALIVNDKDDNKKYKTVTIGGQVWMAENLKPSKTTEETDAALGFYSWNAAKSACPTGSHLPSKDEWEVLVEYAGGQLAAPKKLVSSLFWDASTDEFGFGAHLYGVYYLSKKQTFSQYDEADFWTSSEGSYMSIRKNGGASMGSIDDGYGLNVRCLLD